MTKTPSAIIHDGMTRRGYVPERQYVCGPVRFSYRPMNVPARARYFQQLERQTTAVGRETVSCSMMALHLVDWDLRYPDDHPDTALAGQPVPTNDPDLIYHQLEPYLQRMIAGMIVGAVASAPDPEDQSADREDAARQDGLSPREMMDLLAKDESKQIKN